MRIFKAYLQGHLNEENAAREKSRGWRGQGASRKHRLKLRGYGFWGERKLGGGGPFGRGESENKKKGEKRFQPPIHGIR